MLIATIDTGTTNTRVCIWRDGVVVAEAGVAVGVRNTATSGSKAPLTEGVAKALRDAARGRDAEVADLGLIVASGMITSNVGLVEIPHVTVPAGVDQLAAAMQAHSLPDIAPQPLWFVPGVRNAAPEDPLADYRSIDFMRGEEVETFALLAAVERTGPAVVVLPGSHNKFVVVDSHGRIVRCMTTLSGELLAVLTQNTVLAGTLQGVFVQTLDDEWLCRGARHSAELGIGSAAFAVRGLGLFAGATREQCANFLLGAVLSSDVQALADGLWPGVPAQAEVLVAGAQPLAAAVALLIRLHPALAGRVRCLPPSQGQHLAGRGALMVAARRGLIGR